MRPPQGEPRAGERRHREDVGVRPSDDDRVARRCCYDDPRAGPSHAPPTEAGGEFDDFRR